MENYHEEQNRLNLKLVDTIIKVAAFMPGWTYAGSKKTDGEEYQKGHVYIRNGEKAISCGWQTKKRLVFRGQWPDYPATKANQGRYFSFSGYDLEYKKRVTEITCAWERDPQAIAGDILRRLVPPYLELFQIAKDRIAAEDKSLNEKNRRITFVCKVLGEPVRDEWLREGAYPDVGEYNDIRIQLHSTDYNVKFTIRNDESLKRVVETIRYYMKRDKEQSEKEKAKREASAKAEVEAKCAKLERENGTLRQQIEDAIDGNPGKDPTCILCDTGEEPGHEH